MALGSPVNCCVPTMDFNARVRYIPRHEKFVFSSQVIKLGAFISDVYFKYNLHSDRVALIGILTPLSLVSFAAVFRVVTQRSWGRGALRDFGPSGCEGDYFKP